MVVVIDGEGLSCGLLYKIQAPRVHAGLARVYTLYMYGRSGTSTGKRCYGKTHIIHCC